MHEYILFAIIGLTAGCIHAALAMGLVTTYRGTGVTPQLGGGWTIAGELTVRDVTQPVALEGVFIGAIVDPALHVRLAFQANAAFSRKEFGLTAELERESGGFLLGRDISVEIHAEATRSDGARP